MEGLPLLYAHNMTDCMAKVISETERRRSIKQVY
jgi:excinuclease UvrABC helicase subunit UvrB